MKEVTHEQELFFWLTIGEESECTRMQELLDGRLDYYQLLGYLSCNRVAGLAYSRIRRLQLYVRNDQFLFALENLFHAQRQRTEILQRQCVEINHTLQQAGIPFALLKGAILSGTLYRPGERTSNDIDVLINGSDITAMVEAAKPLGFIQGEYDIKTRRVIEPTRKEVVFRRMNWGEAYPLVKILSGDGLVSFLEIDINFSLGWLPKDEHGAVAEMLTNTEIYGDRRLQSLNRECFLIHLLMHLYKELILYDCVEVMRDMEFYKFVDIFGYLRQFGDSIQLERFLSQTNAYQLVSPVYTALSYIQQLFGPFAQLETIDRLLDALALQGAKREDDIHDYERNKDFQYPGSALERLFDPYRAEHLVER